MVVGTVVIGLSTSAPELVTSIEAALLNLPGLALGSVIRSNIANLTLILGLATATIGRTDRSRSPHRLAVNRHCSGRVCRKHGHGGTLDRFCANCDARHLHISTAA